MPIPERHNPTFTPQPAPAPPPAEDRIALARDRLIVALDVPTAPAAAALADRLHGVCRWFKVGMELYTAAGPAVLDPLLQSGASVFLDLKFCDIPNTVAGAVRSAAALGVHMLTLHASGGPAMLAAAHTALDGLAHPPRLLAVTVLTSMDQSQLAAIGLSRSPADQVDLLARMGLAAGIDGFVCSPQEVAALRAFAGPDAALVVPGIRPASADTPSRLTGVAQDDQKRIATPADALRNGASYLVVGRPITQAKDPVQAANAILEEMSEAL